ncbi:MAG: phosphoribosylformylglycinamidine synthase subunit PurL [Candidatus Micrarchaeota archaeon]
MAKRIEVKFKEQIKDPRAEHLTAVLCAEFAIKINQIRIIDVYNIDADLDDNELKFLCNEVFSDKIVQEYSYSKPFFEHCWRIEIGFHPGITDNIGKTAKDGIKDALGKEIEVYSSTVYAISGNEIEEEICEKLGKRIANSLIQKIIVRAPFSDKFEPYIPKVVLMQEIKVETIEIPSKENALKQLSKMRLLALSVNEMKAIKKYIARALTERKKVGLGEKITDVELEVIAQTWSEHCKHKIFNAEIEYNENGTHYSIDSLFKTFICGATECVKKPYIISAFKDNGGIIKFNSDYNIAVKVETHNAPSALDPYGGALTGILGVNRDIIGTGLGAYPIANTDVLCFGNLNEKKIPEGVLHPRRIYQGVIEGIRDGGNKSGIPTVNGSIIFENGFCARPIIYCGTIGLMPDEIKGRKTVEKKVEPDYLAIMVGGRVGKDGIHGATFSSQHLESNIPTSVVQIGDPITQKKVLDFIMEAQRTLLYESITDNGAGGLSSSIGEMAIQSNGCEIWLDAVPLKYPGLQPWEILVSESQERMTLAIKKENLEKLTELAKRHEVEISVIAKFTNTGKFHALYKGNSVAYLDISFLHKPPRMKLVAKLGKKTFLEPNLPKSEELSDVLLSDVLKKLLACPNISSKEHTIRRYDHEVQGKSVIKPLMGNNAPCDGAVLKLLFDSWEGIVVSHGICPKCEQDSYDMATIAFDEAVRNALAVGAKFGYLAALDNFSWPDPVQSEKTPDGEYKLAQLVRACIGVYDYAVGCEIPIVSGKDSMKNDYYGKDGKYSIPPTLLITVVGKINDVRNAISSEFKCEGDAIYIIGITRDELGGSEYYKLFGGIGNNNPKINTKEVFQLYNVFSKACEFGLVRSAHDISDGGFCVALAECSFSSAFGAEVDISKMPGAREMQNESALLFSESGGRFVVSVAQKNCEKFEMVMRGTKFARIGRVRGDKRFVIKKSETILINEDIRDLKTIWSSIKL